MSSAAKPQNGKVSEQSKPASPPNRRSGTRRDILHVSLLTLLLGGVSYASQFIQHPLFGKTLSASWFRFGAFVSIVLGRLALPDSDKSRSNALRAAAFVLVTGSIYTRAIGVWASENVTDPALAPLLGHAAFGFLALALGGGVWVQLVRNFTERESEATKLGYYVFVGFSCFALANCTHYLDRIIGELISWLTNITAKMLAVNVGISLYMLASTLNPPTSSTRTTGLEPSFALSLIPVVMALIAIVANPLKFDPPTGFSILSQTQSTTGLIQVVDNNAANRPSRIIRSDSSTLGAAFLAYDKMPETVAGNTMDPTSVLQEAVRMVTEPKGSKALVIGTGTGYIASSLLGHNFNTTLIEKDRAVYDAARQHFGLPEPNAVHITDPAQWVWNHSPSAGKFDVVALDLFTGSELIMSLASVEFWQSLVLIMNEPGVVSIRFAAKPQPPFLIKSLFHTLLSVFGTCRVYHANPIDVNQLESDGVVDFVAFCTPGATLTSQSEDTLKIFAKREIDIASVLGESVRERYIMKENDGRLQRWGKEIAVENWKAVRKTVPAGVWYVY